MIDFFTLFDRNGDTKGLVKLYCLFLCLVLYLLSLFCWKENVDTEELNITNERYSLFFCFFVFLKRPVSSNVSEID